MLARAERKREREMSEDALTLSSFRSFTRKRETERNRESARRKKIRKPSNQINIGAFADRKQTTHPKKKRARARALTFLIFHISMFSSWSSRMDAIFSFLFSYVICVCVCACVRVQQAKTKEKRVEFIFVPQKRKNLYFSLSLSASLVFL